MWPESFQVIERINSPGGEIQLQKREQHYEIIYNGVFLMATYNGASERAAVRRALDSVVPLYKSGVRMLMGGLGMGYSLQEALRWPQVGRVLIAEIEDAVVRWNLSFLGEYNDDALHDPRVSLLNEDFVDVVLAESKRRGANTFYHVVLTDTDNGSTWLSRPGNELLYSRSGLEQIQKCLLPGGVACFWCSCREEEFEARLKQFFKKVEYESILEETGQEGGFYLCF